MVCVLYCVFHFYVCDGICILFFNGGEAEQNKITLPRSNFHLKKKRIKSKDKNASSFIFSVG